MKFTKTGTYGDTTEILYNDHFVGKPITVDLTGVSGGVMKAGTPLAADGGAAVTTESTSDAVGVLLYDVSADNPNGTIVIHGFIDTAKAQAHSGVTVDAATKTALKMILFC